METVVFVIGQTGKRLMPTTPAKARKLLKEKKARVDRKVPFTIRLDYQTGGATQPLTLGVDTGAAHIGIAVCTEDKAFYKAEVEMRRSMEKKALLAKRAEFRRGRRHRKVRYRHPKFRCHTKRVYIREGYKKGGKIRHWKKEPNNIMTNRQAGWLPPSIQSKVDHHAMWIRRYLNVLPEGTKVRIEVARFDVERMKNPQIRGELYQQGRMYGYENKKAYVLAKFSYTCPICRKKFDKDHRPRMHHVTMRKNGATDNPDEYAPICEKCHTGEAHLPGGVLDKLAKECKRKEYREPAFMNILRRRMWRIFPDAEFTYGNITSADRKKLGLSKTHANDAVAIAMRGKDHVKDCTYTISYKQVRRKKRSLHEANPRKGISTPNREAKRNCKNVPQVETFCLYDKVLDMQGRTGYISGFTGKSAYVVDFAGNYLKPPGKSYKQQNLSALKLISHSGNWIWEVHSDAAVSHD